MVLYAPIKVETEGRKKVDQLNKLVMRFSPIIKNMVLKYP